MIPTPTIPGIDEHLDSIQSKGSLNVKASLFYTAWDGDTMAQTTALEFPKNAEPGIPAREIQARKLARENMCGIYSSLGQNLRF